MVQVELEHMFHALQRCSMASQEVERHADVGVDGDAAGFQLHPVTDLDGLGVPALFPQDLPEVLGRRADSRTRGQSTSHAVRLQRRERRPTLAEMA